MYCIGLKEFGFNTICGECHSTEDGLLHSASVVISLEDPTPLWTLVRKTSTAELTNYYHIYSKNEELFL